MPNLVPGNLVPGNLVPGNLVPENLVPGMSLTCVKDPDGNIVELIGPTPK